MDERPAALGVTYFPHVSMGWDGSPRNYSMGIVLNNTPEQWGEFLRQTKSWLDHHPESKGIVTLNSWNEWVEGSYIEPDTVNGMKYLEAVKAVFPHASTNTEGDALTNAIVRHHADRAGRQSSDGARAVMTACAMRSACARSNRTQSIDITMSSSVSANEAARGPWSTW